MGHLIAGVRRRLRQIYHARFAPQGLSIQQAWMLMVLHEQGPLCLKELADFLWMDDPTASRVLKALLKSGWVTTRSGGGRRLRIEISEAARGKVDALHAETLTVRQGLIAGLSPAEESQLRGLLLRLLSNLDALEGQGPSSVA